MALFSNSIFFSQYKNNYFISSADKYCGFVIEMNEFFLLDFNNSPILKAFREFPKNLKINTNSQTYLVFDFIYKDLFNNQINNNQVTLNINDSNIFSKIIDLINCQKVHISSKDLLPFQKMAKELNILSLSKYIENLNKELPADIVLDPRSLIDFMMKQPENFSITTRKKTYKCNKIAASVSEVIKNLIQKDNTVESFYYDFSDDNEEFQLICDYLNFKPIVLTPQNIEIIEKIAKDMKFEMLIKILKRIKNMNCQYDVIIDKYQNEIDENVDLFDILLTNNEEDCSNFIIQSKWLDNEQLQKELLGSILSLVYSSPKLISKMALIISILFEKIKLIQVKKNELKNVNLNLLKKYLMKKISGLIIDSHIGPFIYELIKHNFIKLSKSLNENIENDDDDDSDLLLQCVNNQYIALWILPELDLIVPNLQKFVEKTLNNSCTARPFQKYMNFEFMKDNWKLFKNLREQKQSNDSIALSIINDDVEQFQKLIYTLEINQKNEINRNTNYFDHLLFMNKRNKKYNDQLAKINNIIPVFEFDLYSGRSYIDYAAFHGSIKCFKFLILNGATITTFTFDAAIESGNIELVRIIEQKLEENGLNSFCNGEKINKAHFIDYLSLDCSVFPRYYLAFMNNWNGIARAIYKHNNDIFDWIFENKKIDQNELYNLLRIACASNNAYVLSRILSANPIFASEWSNNLLLSIISNADSFRFSLFIKILIEFYGENNYKNLILAFGYSRFCQYKCDNIDLFKMTCHNENDIFVFINLCQSDSTNIIKYCFKKTNNIKFLEYLSKYAIKNANEEIFEFILNQIKLNISSNQQEILFNKLLILSVKSNYFPILKLIIENSTNKKDSQKIIKCLIISAENGYEKIFNYLLKFLSEENTKLFINELKKNFFKIIQSCNIHIIKCMIKYINDEKYVKRIIFDALVEDTNKIINSKRFDIYQTTINKNESTLFSLKNVINFLISYIDDIIPEFLLSATCVNNIEAVKTIVSKNSTYNFLNNVINSNGNALILACRIQSVEIVRFLLTTCKEIDPNIGCYLNRKYCTPLMISFSNKSVEIIKEIIKFYQLKEETNTSSFESSIKDNQCTKEIKKALSMINDSSISHADQEFANLLSIFITVDGININEIYCGDSPFLYLIVNDKLIDLFNIALSLPNVNPNVYNYTSKQTPLMKAIQTNQMKIVLALLSHKNIDINFESINHITALSIAISTKNIEIIKLLLQNEKLEMNSNFSECLNSAILSDFEEGVNLLLSKDKSNVNSIIANLNRINYAENFEENIINNSIKLNFDILEYGSNSHSISILQTSVQKGNINIVKSIINHPNFIADKFSLELALFDSIKIKNMEIFELLKNEYLKLIKTDVDLLNLHDLNNNSLIVIASASNNVEFIRSIQKTNIKTSSSLYNNQLAFIVAPSNEMMQLIIETLPGVDLNLPMENGSNYMTALIDFYYSPCNYSQNFNMNHMKNDYNNRNKDLYYLREIIIINKLKFILSNSNLKLTSKDKKNYSFISKAASRIHCVNYSTLTLLVYTSLRKEADKLIDEETKMTQLHFIAENLPEIRLISNISGYNDSALIKYDCEDDFDLFVNHIIYNKKSNILIDEHIDELKKYKNSFNIHLNSIDSLKQTALIKAVLNFNLYFASFLISDCGADIEIADIFGNTVLDYLLMISDMLYNYPNLNNENEIKDWMAEKNNMNNNKLCYSILKNLIESLSSFNCEFICMIIIKLSSYLISPTT